MELDQVIECPTKSSFNDINKNIQTDIPAKCQRSFQQSDDVKSTEFRKIRMTHRSVCGVPRQLFGGMAGGLPRFVAHLEPREVGVNPTEPWNHGTSFPVLGG